MTDTTSIEKEIASISLQIESLQKRKSTLEHTLLNSAVDFVTKFNIWYNNSDDSFHDWYPDRSAFPLLREKLDSYDLHRYETYDLEWIFEEELYLVEDPKSSIDDMGQEEYDKKLKEAQPFLEECMNGNLKSFKCDW